MAQIKNAQWLVGALAVAVALMCSALRAIAQYRPVTQRELDRYAEVLDLSEAQHATLSEMLDGCAAMFARASNAHREASKRTAARMKVLMDRYGPLEGADKASEDSECKRLEREQDEASEGLRQAMRAAEIGFLDDMELVLTAAQAARMDVVRRTRRRIRFLWLTDVPIPSPRAAVDLVDLVDEMGLPAAQEAALTETLEAWAEAVDVSLRKVERLVALDSPLGFSYSRDDRKQIQNAAADVLQATERHMRLLSGAMPEDAVRRLQEAFQAAQWPEIYAAARVAPLLEAASALGLDTERREALDGLLAWQRKERRQAQKLWRKAAEKAVQANSAFLEGRLDLPREKRAWYHKESPEAHAKKQADEAKLAAQQACDDLNERTRQKLRKILTDAQFETLPEMQ